MEAAITAAIASTSAAITNVVTDNLAVVLVIMGSLIGLGIVLRLLRRAAGRKA